MLSNLMDNLDNLQLTTIAILSATSILIYILLARLQLYLSLRHFDGPTSAGFSWWWHTKSVIGGRAHEYYAEATERYGSIVRIAPNHLLTSDAEFWARINAVRSSYTRSPWYYHAARLEPGKDNVFTECDTQQHEVRRKKMASAYSGKENPTLEPTIDTHVKELVGLMRKYAQNESSRGNGQSMDLSRKIPYFTLDVISHLSLGQAFGNLVADADQRDYLKSTEEGLRAGNAAFALGAAWMKDHRIIGPLISPSEKDKTGYGRMMAEARKLIEARRVQSYEEKSDMIASFMRNGVEGDDLFQEVFEQIIAGSDTTAAAIRIIMLYIMTHPRVYVKLRAEIDEAVSIGLAPSSPEVISNHEARGLSYLGAVIRESMRVQPPVANLFSRVAPSEGDVVVIDGEEKFIPAGTLVSYCALGMHRYNRTVYGEDAEVFRPERWLEDDGTAEWKSRLAVMEKTNDMVFGHGRWSCLGRNVALLEIYKVIFELWRHFDFAPRDPTKPWHVFNTLGLLEISNMWVDVTLRS